MPKNGFRSMKVSIFILWVTKFREVNQAKEKSHKNFKKAETVGYKHQVEIRKEEKKCMCAR